MPLVITKQMARDAGMTHEGKIYGVPVWMGHVNDPEYVDAVAKIYPLSWWMTFRGWVDDMIVDAVYLLFRHQIAIETPIEVIRPIGKL